MWTLMSLRTRVADHRVAITYLIECIKSITTGFRRVNRKLIDLEKRIDSLEKRREKLAERHYE